MTCRTSDDVSVRSESMVSAPALRSSSMLSFAAGDGDDGGSAVASCGYVVGRVADDDGVLPGEHLAVALGCTFLGDGDQRGPVSSVVGVCPHVQVEGAV